LKEENLTKYIFVREGLKEIFIEIRDKTSYKKVVEVLIKSVKEKKIKEVRSLHRFLIAKNAKEWAESFSKNGNGKDGTKP
jgi:hypothetical protein